MVQLEKAAKKLTLYSRAIREQLARAKEEVGIEQQAVLTSEDDVSESSARLQEIEELMNKLQRDIGALRTTAIAQEDDNGSLAAREQELEELREERYEELELLTHIQKMLHRHQSRHRDMQRMIASLTKESRRVRQREEAIVLVALRSRIVKVFGAKL
ncbi:unnamed protein product [Hyaloperonospora brassicae]|uniref:Uncharacterized protein n=1 Tax=Hyaloperonospora brassicae TaxID=162125 RepID=A0AAV0TRM8_HYABA|nr:unnamed protein product [Hyaloperonospora brassicae]